MKRTLSRGVIAKNVFSQAIASSAMWSSI